MLHDASFPFLVTGLLAVVIGAVALVGGSLPLATVAQWALPCALVAIGVAGMTRPWRRGH